jgi:hypothetical protein
MATDRVMLRTHPRSDDVPLGPLADCIEACRECEGACITCADACTREPMARELAECIRADLDCADACGATLRMLSRVSNSNGRIVRAQVEALAAIAGFCAEECEGHSEQHAHCRVCGEICQACVGACVELLSSM